MREFNSGASIDINTLLDSIKKNKDDRIFIPKKAFVDLPIADKIKLCIAMRSNTSITLITDFHLNDFDHQSDNEVNEPFSNQTEKDVYYEFIKNIANKNANMESKNSCQNYKNQPITIFYMAKNFDELVFKPIELGEYLGKTVFSAIVLPISWLLNKIPSSNYYQVALPTFSIHRKKKFFEAFEEKYAEISISTGSQLSNFTPYTAIIVPFTYVLRNLGKLVGIIIAIPFSLLLSPVSLIKSFWDSYKRHKTLNKSIQSTEDEIKKSEVAIEETSKNFIFEEFLYSEANDLHEKNPMAIFGALEQEVQKLQDDNNAEKREVLILGAIQYFSDMAKNESYALANLSHEEVAELKILMSQDCPKIQSINLEEQEYTNLLLTGEEISAIQRKVQEQDQEKKKDNIKDSQYLSAKLVLPGYYAESQYVLGLLYYHYTDTDVKKNEQGKTAEQKSEAQQNFKTAKQHFQNAVNAKVAVERQFMEYFNVLESETEEKPGIYMSVHSGSYENRNGDDSKKEKENISTSVWQDPDSRKFSIT